jgi:hypothetical protein
MTASMIDKIAKWIRSNESKGYTEDELRIRLLQRGYNTSDVAQAIKLTKSESTVKKVERIKDVFKNMFKPTFLKVFLTAILLLSIILFFFIAPYFYHFTGQVSCKVATYGYDIGQYNSNVIQPAQSSDTAPDEFIKLLKFREDSEKKFGDDIISLRSNANKGAIIAYAVFSTVIPKVHILNPLFPVPCTIASTVSDISFTEFTGNNKYCYDFYSKDDRACVKDIFDKETRMLPEGLSANDIYNSEDQIHVGVLWSIFNSILLLAIFYVLLCLVIASLESLLILGRKYLVLSFVLMFFLLVIFGGYNDYVAFFMVLVMLLQIIVFIDSVKVRAIVLVSIFTLILVILLTLLFNVVVGGFGSSVDPKSLVSDYKVIYCNSTKTLSEINASYNNLVSGLNDNSINVSYGAAHNLSVCYNPYCSTLCNCNIESEPLRTGKDFTLAGTKPSCVCQCRNLE